MLCGNCHKENPPTNAFCCACGTRMGDRKAGAAAVSKADEQLVLCSRCNAANRSTMKFCKECGTPLTSIAAQLPIADPDSVSLSYPGPQVETAVLAREQSSDGVVCSQCKGVSDLNSKFCKYCGTPVNSDSIPDPSSTTTHIKEVPEVSKTETSAQLVIILRNGTEGQVFLLKDKHTDIGSREGHIILSDDPYLSYRHARIIRKNDTFVLKDLSSTNGIYVRVNEPTELADKDMILVGQQVLRFEIVPRSQQRVGPAIQHGVMVFGTPEAPRLARLVQYTTEGLERDVYYLSREDTVLGREQADIVFPDDPFLSRRHAMITMNDNPNNYILRDLGSSNGTALRCRNEYILQHGDQFRLGRHLFRFDLLQCIREDHT